MKNFGILFLFCTIFTVAGIAQENKSNNALTGILQGLTKATNDSGSPKPLILDSVKIYSEEGRKLNNQDFGKFMMSGEYSIEPYVNIKEEVKVLILRKASEEEKVQIKKMMEGQNKKSDLIGTKATNFSFTDLSGKKYDLDQLKGKIVVLNFWFVGCKPCIMEIPELNKLVDEFKGKDVVFLGLSTDQAEKIETFLKTQEFKYNLVPDCMKIAKSYNVQGFPTHMVIGKDSVIRLLETGLYPNTIENIKAEINRQLDLK